LFVCSYQCHAWPYPRIKWEKHWLVSNSPVLGQKILPNPFLSNKWLLSELHCPKGVISYPRLQGFSDMQSKIMVVTHSTENQILKPPFVIVVMLWVEYTLFFIAVSSTGQSSNSVFRSFISYARLCHQCMSSFTAKYFLLHVTRRLLSIGETSCGRFQIFVYWGGLILRVLNTSCLQWSYYINYGAAINVHRYVKVIKDWGNVYSRISPLEGNQDFRGGWPDSSVDVALPYKRKSPKKEKLMNPYLSTLSKCQCLLWINKFTLIHVCRIEFIRFFFCVKFLLYACYLSAHILLECGNYTVGMFC